MEHDSHAPLPALLAWFASSTWGASTPDCLLTCSRPLLPPPACLPAPRSLMPGAMHSVDIVMANPGISTVQCRVADHISAGGPHFAAASSAFLATAKRLPSLPW